MPKIAAASNRILHRIDQSLLSYSKAKLTAIIGTIQGLLVYVDFLTGPWIPFGVFYLLSLYLSVKYLGIRTAYVMALVIVFGKTYVRAKAIPIDLFWWQILWQFISSYSIYSFFCYLINTQLNARKAAETIAIQATNRAGAAERKLLNISEETQQRIGRELHDDLGQQLTGIAFMTQVLSQKLATSGCKESKDAERITSMLNQSISKTRSMAHGLYPAELDEHGFISMMQKFSDHVEITYHVICEFSSDKNCRVDDQEIAIHLFRISQEAVNNAIKHGKANRIVLHMSCQPAYQTLKITDNGYGINPDKMMASAGLGMRSMRYRVDLIGASINISKQPKSGTQVEIILPTKT